MIQFKSFACKTLDKLESEVNEFLKTLDSSKFLDLSFQPDIDRFCVYILYEK